MSSARKYSEDELLQLLKRKDKSAFSYLYDTYSSTLYGIVLRILKNDEKRAEEVFRAAFLEIWQKIDTCDSTKGTIFIWMLNIIRNSAKNHTITQKSISIQSPENNVHEIVNMDLTIIIHDNNKAKEIVNNLSPEYKMVIDMAYFEGYTQQEISKKLNVSVGTVMTRTREALIEIRRILS